jgi:hypothetical protein
MVDLEFSCVFSRSKYKRDGYPCIFLSQGKVVYLHRKALENKLGRKIHQGMMALHICHNRDCINPDHLYEGTHLDNMRDMVQSGRSAKGSRQGSSKLTEYQVEEIKDELARGVSGATLAHKHGVHKSQISRIKNNKTWIHV